MSHRVRWRVIGAFEQWAGLQGLMPSDHGEAERWRNRIEVVLHGREAYLHKPDPTRWKSGDVHDLLVDYVACRQVDGWGLTEHGAATVRLFLRFLDDTDRLHPASAKGPTLAKELDRVESRFPAAMADSSRWGLAKRVLTAMVADGVPLDADEADIDAWAERFSALNADGRRRVLGDLMDQHPGYIHGRLLIHDGNVAVLRPGMPAEKHLVWPDAPCTCHEERSRSYPTVSMPDVTTLAGDVAGPGGGLLRELARLASWVGPDGRPTDRRGELSRQDLADAATALSLPAEPATRLKGLPALAKLWRLALELDVLQLRRTRVMCGDGSVAVEAALRGTGPAQEAVELWTDVFDLLVNPLPPEDAHKDSKRIRDWLQPWTPRLLGLLYAQSPDGEDCDLDRVTAEVLVENADRIPPGDPQVFESVAAMAMRQSLADLARHGAVEVTDTDALDLPRERVDAGLTLGFAAWALHPVDGLRVRLTDLGRCTVRQRLLGEDAIAPLVTTASG